MTTGWCLIMSCGCSNVERTRGSKSEGLGPNGSWDVADRPPRRGIVQRPDTINDTHEDSLKKLAGAHPAARNPDLQCQMSS